MLPKSNPRLRKSYFVVDTPNGPSKDFGKHAYQLISSKTFTLIHYLGNETVAIPFVIEMLKVTHQHHLLEHVHLL